MKTIGYNLLIKIDTEVENTMTVGGKELFFEGDFNPLYNARRYGTVHATNDKLESIGLKVGRVVHFHHFVPLESNETHWHVSHRIDSVSDDQSKIYEANCHPKSTQVYAYEDEKGELHTLYNYLFIEPIINDIPQTESGIYLGYEEEEEVEVGIVKYMNSSAKEAGLSVGDKVRFAKDCEYDMEIKGETLYRMTVEDIYFIHE